MRKSFPHPKESQRGVIPKEIIDEVIFHSQSLRDRLLLELQARNGVPLEIISKVLLRHQNLKTTQVYLGKVSEAEAIRWMDTLHGK
jgi:hypothetical protein